VGTKLFDQISVRREVILYCSLLSAYYKIEVPKSKSCSKMCCIIGLMQSVPLLFLANMGNISFGCSFVAERSLVPRPAAGSITLLTKLAAALHNSSKPVFHDCETTSCRKDAAMRYIWSYGGFSSWANTVQYSVCEPRRNTRILYDDLEIENLRPASGF
jgi:hypothetical protein